MTSTIENATAARALIMTAALTLTASAAQAQRHDGTFDAMATDRLESIYLRCADLSTRSVLDPDTATRCSLAADVLRDRRFGGSLEQMLAWWHQTRAPTAAHGSAESARARH